MKPFPQVCEFLLEDILGIQINQTPPQGNPIACEFNIHLFMVTNPLAASRFRSQCTALVLFDDATDFKSNLWMAREWKTKVLKQTRKAVKAAFVDAAESECDGCEASITSAAFECEPIGSHPPMYFSALISEFTLPNFSQPLVFDGC